MGGACSMHTKFGLKHLEGRGHPEDIIVDGGKILK
jgi:hypothetical protein